jgi:hypothetical protein
MVRPAKRNTSSGGSLRTSKTSGFRSGPKDVILAACGGFAASRSAHGALHWVNWQLVALAGMAEV